MRNLKDRQGDVLAIIVKSYVETAEPVGSRFVAKQMGLSSATIRNDMADLEEMGFITHPHTSAGRIPTDKGYRYYIDSLMHLKDLNEHTAKSIRDEYGHAVESLEDIFEKTSHLISNLTSYVGLTIFSDYHKLYLDGASHIIEQPEFRDFKKLHLLMQCLEEKRALLDLLSDDIENDRVTVYIGKESHSQSLNDCSVVARGYKVKGKMSGKVGVIGPKRMMYDRVIPTVEFLADAMSELLEELET